MTQAAFQNILILGASGAIGGAIIRILLQSSATQKLFALSRTPYPSTDPRVTSVELNLESDASLMEA
ncbi:hypothetical protein SMA67_26215, partial [Escherichia coli]